MSVSTSKIDLPADIGDARKTAKLGLWVIAIGLGGFLIWASTAPLARGIAGNGTVSVAGERKSVQALTGGAVDEILVREGDRVRAGQLLIQLNTIQAQSQLDVALGQWLSVRASEARLSAERHGLTVIAWPDDLLSRQADVRAKSIMELQDNLFTMRRAELSSRQQILENQAASLQQQLQSYQQIRSHLETQLNFQHKELSGLRQLAAEGYVPRNRLFEAERNASQLSAQLASGVADIGKTLQSITENRLHVIQLQQTFRIEAESQLATVSAEVASLTERIKALEFEVGNAAIRAPVAGQVIGLNAHTEGGVIAAAQRLMEIVPAGSAWIIKARFEPMVADRLKVDLPVNLRFSSLTSATLPVVAGKVLNVSGDQLLDEQTGLPYFAVEVEVGADAVDTLKSHGLDVKPGMQAEVLVQTGERTFLDYLLSPLEKRIRGALKEE
jgi:protease secretion system membrane fusion protein